MAGVRGFAELDGVLKAAMDAAALRQQVAAHNIANVNTPRFRRSYVRFEDKLAQSMGRRLSGVITHPRHIPFGSWQLPQPEVAVDRSTIMRNDGNNVDIEREMALLSAAEVQYAALTQVAAARYRMLRSAMSQGGR